MNNPLSVFTKPWRGETPEELGALVASFGFTGVELPVRPGFQAAPNDARESLPVVCAALQAHGVSVTSVASELTEEVFAACADCGVPMIRVMAEITDPIGYMGSEGWWTRKLQSVDALCEKYGVMVGVQQHFGAYVAGSMELRHLLDAVGSPWIGAVYDAAHSALCGERPLYAIDILWDYLFMANFKNACFEQTESGRAAAKFEPRFVRGNEGMADWGEAVKELSRRGYEGTVCMHAEYTDAGKTNNNIAEDLKLLKRLMKQVG